MVYLLNNKTFEFDCSNVVVQQYSSICIPIHLQSDTKSLAHQSTLYAAQRGSCLCPIWAGLLVYNKYQNVLLSHQF